MEELIKEIRLLREEVAGLRQAYENRSRNPYAVRKQAEGLLSGLNEKQSNVLRFILNRMEWLKRNNQIPNFDDTYIRNVIRKTCGNYENNEVKDIIRQLIARQLLSIVRNEDGSWQWGNGKKVEDVVKTLNDKERQIFYNSFFLKKND